MLVCTCFLINTSSAGCVLPKCMISHANMFLPAVMLMATAGLLQKMLQNVPVTQISQAAMVLCQVALTQPQLKQLPKALFKVCHSV